MVKSDCKFLDVPPHGLTRQADTMCRHFSARHAVKQVRGRWNGRKALDLVKDAVRQSCEPKGS